MTQVRTPLLRSFDHFTNLTQILNVNKLQILKKKYLKNIELQKKKSNLKFCLRPKFSQILKLLEFEKYMNLKFAQI
jgi:hypothetical protein